RHLSPTVILTGSLKFVRMMRRRALGFDLLHRRTTIMPTMTAPVPYGVGTTTARCSVTVTSVSTRWPPHWEQRKPLGASGHGNRAKVEHQMTVRWVANKPAIS